MLCLCLLPVYALAEEPDFNDGTPVTHSEFEIAFRLNADGFPNDGLAHYEDWEAFVQKLGVRGVVDAQSFPMPVSRVRMDFSLLLDGQEALPFNYDGYYTFRYLRSPAFDNASIHFQMVNFFQFMLKPYYYMGLPTNYLGLVMYPECFTEMYQMFGEPIRQTFAGEGTRHVSYDDLYAFAQEISALILEDPNSKIYYFLTCLGIDVGLDYLITEKFSYMEGWLEALDPNQQGMSITAENGVETWTLGETTVFQQDATSWRFTLPDEEGYEFTASWQNNHTDVCFVIEILQDGSSYLKAEITLDGLGDPLSAKGVATLAITGDAMYIDLAPISFAYALTRTAETLPYDMTLAIDYLHPETKLPTVGFTYAAALSELPYTVLTDRPFDNQDDFFNLNESFMEEYKQRFMPTLIKAGIPFALALPHGVISDLTRWMDDAGFLAFFGLE